MWCETFSVALVGRGGDGGDGGGGVFIPRGFRRISEHLILLHRSSAQFPPSASETTILLEIHCHEVKAFAQTWPYWVGGEIQEVIVALSLAAIFTSTHRWRGRGGRRDASGADVEE